MATNAARWVGNMYGVPEPYIMLGLFQKGDTQVIKKGELLELTGGGTTWVPMDSDYSMSGDVAIAFEEIKAGDRAGYYNILVPRPGDLFEFDLTTPGNDAVGTAVYWIDSETVTISAGSNIIGNIQGQANYPQKQEHASAGGTADMGTTIRDQSSVVMTIQPSNSYWSTVQTL